MPEAPREPEKYSIDEMMERLKGRAPESAANGELVTREDGSQAIRVRKRKRRSSQPHKEKQKRAKWVRVVQVAAVVLVLFVGILGIGGGMLFANSAPFRESLLAKISRTTGAEAKMLSFRMNPKTANAVRLDLAWPEGNVLERLTLDGISAQVSPSSFLGSSFSGDEVTINNGYLALRPPATGKPLTLAPSDAGVSPIQFKQFRIPTLQVTIGSPTQPALSLTRSEASLGFKPGGGPQLRLYQGDLVIQGWPKLRLDRALVDLSKEQANVIQFRVLHESDGRGSIDLSGAVSPYRTDQDSKLAVTMDSFPLSGLLGPQLARLVSGRISSGPASDANRLTFRPSAKADSVFESSFVLSPGTALDMQGFPFLFTLARELGDEWFERPIFEGDAEGIVRRENGTVTLGKLNIENKGRLALKGSIRMDSGGNLGGDLEVGLTDAMIASSKNPSLGRLFGDSDGNYRWVSLKISGTASNPGDNLKQLLTSGAERSRSEPAPASPSRPPTFEELTRPR